MRSNNPLFSSLNLIAEIKYMGNKILYIGNGETYIDVSNSYTSPVEITLTNDIGVILCSRTNTG